MRTRCPHCRTAYDVAPQTVQRSQGLARCYRCNQVFNAFENAFDGPPKAEVADEDAAEPHPLEESDTSFLIEDAVNDHPATATEPAISAQEPPRPETPELSLAPMSEEAPAAAPEAPPSVPETWIDTPLPSVDHGILKGDIRPPPQTPRKPPWWQYLVVALLALLLLAQLAWLRRDLWIDLPQAAQLCALFDCQLPDRYRPQDFTVIERSMTPDAGPPAALHLWLAIRNDAPFAQPLPRLQLSLQDATGTLVARRLFEPRQYLPGDWSGPPAALPGEVVTIELHLKDPGPHVQGFVIDFL